MKNISKIENRIRIYTITAKVIVVLGAIIPLVLILSYLFELNCIIKNEGIGSYLSGTTGSLWALAGIFFIYVAFLGQKQEMILNADQIKRNGEEIEKQRLEIERQNNIIETQMFENSFFKLLKHLNNYVENMKFNGYNPRYTIKYRGRDCFKYYYDEVLNKKIKISQEIDKESLNIGNKIEVKLIAIINLKFLENNIMFSSYFKILTSIIGHISDSNLKKKEFYFNVIESQMSKYELISFFYFVLSVSPNKSRIDSLRQYNFFETLDKNMLFDITPVQDVLN